MSEIVLNAQQLNTAHCECDEDNSEVVSDSETSSIEKCNKIVENIKTEQGFGSKNICLPNICQSNLLLLNNDTKPNIGNVTVQSSSHTMFGNKTIYNAPVTINHFGNEENSTFDKDQFKKLQWKFANKKVVFVVIAGILICLSFLTLLFILMYNKNGNDKTSPIFSE